MDLDRLGRNWEELGRRDPLWAILSRSGHQGGKWDPDEFFATGRGFVQWLGERFQQWGIERPAGRALDFGCGYGRLSQALAPHFTEVVGVDIAESMLAGARRLDRSGGVVRYVRNERPDLGMFGDASFDFVLSVIVLQHMAPDYQRGYLREFLRVLRPGGVAFVQTATVPKANAAGRGAAAVEQAGEAIIEVHCLPAEEVRALVQAAGGQVVVEEADAWAGADWESAHWVVGRVGG